MTDSTHEIARAQHALTAPAAVPDRQVLGAVHTGLLRVPSEAPSSGPGAARRRDDEDAAPQLAVRRRRVV